MSQIDKLSRALQLPSPHRLNAEAVEEHCAAVLVPELLEQAEALPVESLGRLVLAGDVRRAPYARSASARTSGGTVRQPRITMGTATSHRNERR